MKSWDEIRASLRSPLTESYAEIFNKKVKSYLDDKSHVQFYTQEPMDRLGQNILVGCTGIIDGYPVTIEIHVSIIRQAVEIPKEMQYATNWVAKRFIDCLLHRPGHSGESESIN